MEIMTIDQLVSIDEQDNLKKIKFYDRNTNINALILGKLIGENIEFGYWKKLGYESFSDFIGQSNFSFTSRTAYNYVDLWKMFCKFAIDMDRFTEIPYSKLLKLKDVITEENLEEWLEKAKTLSRTDLELEVREKNCQLAGKPFIPMPKMYLCSECNRWVIDVDPSDICQCGKSSIKGEDVVGMKEKVKKDEWSLK